jgi:hypothetical protein
MSAEARGQWEARVLKEEEVETKFLDQLHRRTSVPGSTDRSILLYHYSEMKSLARQFTVVRNIAVKPWGARRHAGGAACGYGSSADLSSRSQTKQADSSLTSSTVFELKLPWMQKPPGTVSMTKQLRRRDCVNYRDRDGGLNEQLLRGTCNLGHGGDATSSFQLRIRPVTSASVSRAGLPMMYRCNARLFGFCQARRLSHCGWINANANIRTVPGMEHEKPATLQHG